MYKSILVATDGSYHSKAAEDRAIELSLSYSSKLASVFVVDSQRFQWAEELIHEVYSKVKKEGEEVLRSFREKAAKQGLEVEVILAEGHPASEIVKLSERYDLIVMGSRGYGAEEVTLGSVAQRVVRKAKCDVLVVKG